MVLDVVAREIGVEVRKPQDVVGQEPRVGVLLDEEAERALLANHILRLADLYADLARDYVEGHERPLDFREGEFVSRADRALDTYRKVAMWDGAPEKPEAQARFTAFDAYKTDVLARYR